MGPRFTVSGQMVERSTVGAAGLSRDTATTATVNNTTATPAHTAYWRILFFFKSGRAISITPWIEHLPCQRDARLNALITQSLMDTWARCERLKVTGSGATLFDSEHRKFQRERDLKKE